MPAKENEMKSWICTFTDGTTLKVRAADEYDARETAEKQADKTVAGGGESDFAITECTPLKDIYVNTSEYEFSHGKAPRGRGSWGFYIGQDKKLEQVFWHNGSYAEALKAAKLQASDRGAHEIKVAS